MQIQQLQHITLFSDVFFFLKQVQLIATRYWFQKEEEKQKLLQTEEYAERVEEMPFNYLMCDLPPPPLFPDGMQENIIPQVPIFQILNKFNGIQEKEYKTYKDSTMKKFELTRLPPYIILYFKVGEI